MAWVVFLKGVNVGGHRTFRPSALAEELRPYDVVNIGAAGTFVVRSRVPRKRLEEEILGRLPFDAEVMIRDARKFLQWSSEDPFAGQPTGPDVVRFASVAARRPEAIPTIPMNLPSRGRWCVKVLALRGDLLFGLYRREMKAIRFLSQLEKVVGVSLTTRSWNTVLAMTRVLADA
ncbi:MAG: DUF1697 domain-containing protein [Acidobacteriota bacterium]